MPPCVIMLVFTFRTSGRVASRRAAGFRSDAQIAGIDEAHVSVIFAQPFGVEARGFAETSASAGSSGCGCARFFSCSYSARRVAPPAGRIAVASPPWQSTQRQAHCARGMHGRLVGGGVAGNATGVLTIHFGLGLSEQALLLLRGRLGCENAPSSNNAAAMPPAITKKKTQRRAIRAFALCSPPIEPSIMPASAISSRLELKPQISEKRKHHLCPYRYLSIPGRAPTPPHPR